MIQENGSRPNHRTASFLRTASEGSFTPRVTCDFSFAQATRIS